MAVPAVGRSSVVSIRRVVVLPAPFGPRKPTISPASTVRSTPRTACTVRLLLVKVRARPLASMIGMIVLPLCVRGWLPVSSNISMEFKLYRELSFRRFARLPRRAAAPPDSSPGRPWLAPFGQACPRRAPPPLRVELVMPADLGLEVHLGAPHDRRLQAR